MRAHRRPAAAARRLFRYKNRWTIKARITAKDSLKTWNNARGTGTLFKIKLLDDKGGEIAGCFFNGGANKFHPILQVNEVYTFTNGRIKVANKQYSSCKSEYEISFGADADIRLCEDDANIEVTIAPHPILAASSPAECAQAVTFTKTPAFAPPSPLIRR